MRRRSRVLPALVGGLFLLSLALPSLVGAQQTKFGTTVITPGYKLDVGPAGLEGEFPWVIEMAKEIRDRAGKAKIYILREGRIEYLNGKNVPVRGGIPLRNDRENIVLLDWSKESDILCEGYAEAAGDALAAYLILGAKEKYWDLRNLHFIGHSRGAVVVSETGP